MNVSRPAAQLGMIMNGNQVAVLAFWQIRSKPFPGPCAASMVMMELLAEMGRRGESDAASPSLFREKKSRSPRCRFERARRFRGDGKGTLIHPFMPKCMGR